jgi:hypothetical protein
VSVLDLEFQRDSEPSDFMEKLMEAYYEADYSAFMYLREALRR